MKLFEIKAVIQGGDYAGCEGEGTIAAKDFTTAAKFFIKNENAGNTESHNEEIDRITKDRTLNDEQRAKELKEQGSALIFKLDDVISIKYISDITVAE